MYPLVLDLAADSIPVAVTCRVLGFSKQAFYKWRANPVSQRDWDDAHLIDLAIDIHPPHPCDAPSLASLAALHHQLRRFVTDEQPLPRTRCLCQLHDAPTLEGHDDGTLQAVIGVDDSTPLGSTSPQSSSPKATVTAVGPLFSTSTVPSLPQPASPASPTANEPTNSRRRNPRGAAFVSMA